MSSGRDGGRRGETVGNDGWKTVLLSKPHPVPQPPRVKSGKPPPSPPVPSPSCWHSCQRWVSALV